MSPPRVRINKIINLELTQDFRVAEQASALSGASSREAENGIATSMVVDRRQRFYVGAARAQLPDAIAALDAAPILTLRVGSTAIGGSHFL
jgi:hypothetical protein